MQYRSVHAEVEAEGFAEEAEFSIANSGKMIKGLIDGLYSRKIEAGIRELATNCFDSHIAAGTIQPFEVHLPTTLDPVFWIRDFGTGMSHDLVMRRYTTLGDSTKDGLVESDKSHIAPNKQVGCLGIGSKAFFAYTDSCTITVWQGGKVRHYSVFMGKSGKPRCALAGEAESDEPNGVRVEFAAKKKDLAEFQTAAIRVFKGFPIVPRGLSMEVMRELTIEPLKLGKGWKMFPEAHLPESKFYARQGCVLYPIDLPLISRTINNAKSEYRTFHRAIEKRRLSARGLGLNFERMKDWDQLKGVIILDFPIGAVDFDMSRERLAYTDDTMKSILKQWINFIDALDADFKAETAECKTLWEKMQLLESPLFAAWGPLFVASSDRLDCEELKARLFLSFPKDSSDRGKKLFKQAVRKPDGSYLKVFNRSSALNAPKPGSFADAIVVLNDQPKRKLPRHLISYHLSLGTKEWAFVLEGDHITPEQIAEIGNPPIVKLSDLPDIPVDKAPRTYGGGGGAFHRIKIITADGHATLGAESDEDYDGHLFCFLNRGDAFLPNESDYPVVTTGDVMRTHRVLQRITGQSISFINVKSNETLEKYEDFPLFVGCLDDLPLTMPEHFVRVIIDGINYDRFEAWTHKRVVFDWKIPNTPIGDMLRFRNAWNKHSSNDKFLYRDMANTVSTNWSPEQSFSWFLDAVIDRGVAMGLEVLPPLTAAKQFSARVFSKKWSRVVHAMASPSNHKTFIQSLLKDYASC